MSTVSIDWLSFTIPSAVPTVPSTQKTLFARLGGGIEVSVKPRFGYQWGVKLEPSGITVLGGTKEMGVHVVIPGGACQYANTGIEWAILASRMKWNITRLDLAIDDFTGRFTPDGLHSEMSKARTHAKKVMLLKGDGDTLYVGSRTSTKYLRVYDKARQTDTPGQWVRVEIELKGDAAQNAANALQGNSLAIVAMTAITDFVNFPENAAWMEAMNSAVPGIIEPTRRKLTDTRSWLLGTVAPSLAKEVLSDNDFMRAFLEEVNKFIVECG